MTLVINLLLLVLGTTGALAAFGGETWRKVDGPLVGRITRRGWVALSCMLATLALGITKELRSNAGSRRAAAREQSLREDLAKTTRDLRMTREKLAAVEPNILEAMVIATQGLVRESDFSTPRVSGEESIALTSGRTGGQLLLYGGDQIEYHVFCAGMGGRTSEALAARGHRRLVLMVGGTSYPLDQHGRQMIIGPVGQAMPASLRNPSRLRDCSLKMLIQSADRTREAAQLEPLIRMIRDARSASDDE